MNYASYVRIFLIILTFGLALVALSGIMVTDRAIHLNEEIARFSLDVDADLLQELILSGAVDDLSDFRGIFDFVAIQPVDSVPENMITSNLILSDGSEVVVGRSYPLVDQLRIYKNLLLFTLIIVVILEIIAITVFTKEKVMKPFELMGKITGADPTPDSLVIKLEKMVEDLRENKAELELLYHQEQYKVVNITARSDSILDNLRVGVMDIDKQGKISRGNTALKEIFPQLPLNDGINYDRTDLPGVLIDLIRQVFQQGQTNSARINLEDRIIDVVISPVKVEQEFAGVFLSVYDISEAVYLERILMTKEKLQSFGEMSVGMAHEFRNSAGVILGTAKLLDKKYDREAVQILIDETNSLLSTMEKFLEVVKKQELKFEEFSIKNLTDEIAKNYQWQFHTDIKVDQIYGDRVLLRRAIINLIKNSLENKSSPQDILIMAEQDDNWFKLEVSDKGTGLSEKDIEKVKTPFYSTKSNGLGLGLSIVEKIMDLHQGTLQIMPILQQNEVKGTKIILRWRKRGRDINS